MFEEFVIDYYNSSFLNEINESIYPTSNLFSMENDYLPLFSISKEYNKEGSLITSDINFMKENNEKQYDIDNLRLYTLKNIKKILFDKSYLIRNKININDLLVQDKKSKTIENELNNRLKKKEKKKEKEK